jgi:hypothetical protein
MPSQTQVRLVTMMMIMMISPARPLHLLDGLHADEAVRVLVLVLVLVSS